MNVRTFSTGTWEVSDPPLALYGGRKRKAKTESLDARVEEVRFAHSGNEADEQRGVSPCGAGGAKGRNRGKLGQPKRVPDSVPGERVI